MKESGDLEQDADVVLSVYRENREADKMEVVCLKGRDSGTWKGALYFQRFTQKITDWVD
jgi:replicative DNA helicase